MFKMINQKYNKFKLKEAQDNGKQCTKINTESLQILQQEV
jgi:hypothetical protein